ncbi:MAG: hypothetical protein AAF989_08445, partial [Planctomycetota bacterium]
MSSPTSPAQNQDDRALRTAAQSDMDTSSSQASMANSRNTFSSRHPVDYDVLNQASHLQPVPQLGSHGQVISDHQGTTGLSLTPALLLELPFRHLGTILRSFVVFGILGWLAILAWPRVYESQAKLNIRVGRESVALDPTVTTSETMLLQQTREEEIVSTLEVLGSRQVMMRVVDEIGADNVLDGTVPSKDGTSPQVSLVKRVRSQVSNWLHSAIAWTGVKDDISSQELAIKELQDTVSIYAPKKSSVVTINSESKSPEMAKLLIDTLVRAFKTEHQAASGTPGSFNFFNSESERTRNKLNALIRSRAEFMREHDLVSIETTRAVLKEKITSVTKDILATEALLDKNQEQVTQLQIKVDAMDDEILSSTKQVASNAWALLRQRVFELEVAEQKLTSMYTNEHPQLIRARAQLSDAQKVLSQTQRADKNSDTVVNPAKILAKQDLRRMKTEITGLTALLNEKQTQRQRLSEESRELIDQERQMIGMDRDIEVGENALAVLQTKLEEAR